MIYDAKQSKLLLPKCTNADAATPGAMDLPDGHQDAERVYSWVHRRTRKEQLSVCAPWCIKAFTHPA